MLVAALLVSLAWGALAFGAVYPWAYTPLGIACAGIGLAGLFVCRRGRSKLRPYSVEAEVGGVNRPIAIGLVLVALAIGAQLVPLPHDVVATLSPATTAFLRRYELAIGARHPLSIEPSHTLLALGLFAALGILLLGLGGALTARDARRFAPSLVVVGVVVALVGIVQRAGFNGRIYGFWVPRAGPLSFTVGGGPFGPFVNRNHFAGWMLMAFCVGLGYFCALVAGGMRGVKPGWRHKVLWFASADANRALLSAAALVVMGLAVVMSWSRSGTTCLGIALATCGFVVIRRQQGVQRRAIVAAYTVFVGTVAIGWAGIDTVASHFALGKTDLASRAMVWNDALHMYRDFPIFGSGTNTFGTAMLLYQTADPKVHFAEAHSDYLQFLSEGGLLVAIPALMLLALFVREVRHRFRDDTDDERTYWIRVGAVTGLVAIGLQELVEFSLQMPGNAALFVTVMGIAAGKLPHRRRRNAHMKSCRSA